MFEKENASISYINRPKALNALNKDTLLDIKRWKGQDDNDIYVLL